MSARRSAPYVLAASQSREGDTGFKLRAVDTAGTVSLLEFSLDAWASGPDLHDHHDSDEAFYVLSGLMEMQVGTDRYRLGPGEFAWVPRGTAHTFANAASQPARALTVATPGGLENFLADQARYLASCHGNPDPAVLAEMREQHAGNRLGPPIRSPEAP